MMIFNSIFAFLLLLHITMKLEVTVPLQGRTFCMESDNFANPLQNKIIIGAN